MLAACVQYVLRLCEPDADVRRRVRLILAVLAAPLEKPLPPLDWTVLEPVVDRYVSHTRHRLVLRRSTLCQPIHFGG